MYYDEWVMKLRTHPRMFAAISELWRATWADENAAPLWKAPRPLQPFNASQGYSYIDRAVYRLPLPGSGQRGSLQPGLLPHYDQCPLDLFGERGLLEEAPSRWRPIQSSLALTPVAATNDSGGFLAAPRFHREFAQYYEQWDAISGHGQGATVHCGGQFSVLRDGVRLPGEGEDAAIIKRLQPIAQAAGSAVFWDWRIPHSSTATAEQAGVVTPVPREAVYAGFLPAVALNQRYAAEQLRAYRQRVLPPDFSGGQEIPAQYLAPVMPKAEVGAAGDRQDSQLQQMLDPGLARQLLGASPWAATPAAGDAWDRDKAEL